MTPVRRARHRTILEIVQEETIASQADLVRALKDRGLEVTQATVSRDIHQLGLVKIPHSAGGSHYVTADKAGSFPEPSPNALRHVSDFLVGVDKGQAMLVLRTQTGHANAVCVELDKCNFPEVVGTIAGDDTILVILKREQDRAKMLKQFRDLIE